MKYLRINVIKEAKALYTKNYKTLLKEIKDGIKHPAIPLLSIYPKELKAGLQRGISVHPHSEQHYSQQQNEEETKMDG